MTERIRLERAEVWQKIAQVDWDLVVIGGGITGAGVAREAARRGIRILLIEQRDFAWGTSSRSSKMVHGGLRYIAQGDIKLTWHSLAERERLLVEAPGLVTRMGYWFAHYNHVFPGRFVFGILLRIYDLLAGVRDRRFLKPKDFLARVPGYQGANLTGASRYTDALVDDSRLVMRVLDEACADGALALNYVKADSLIMESGRVSGVNLHDEVTGSKTGIRAKAVINATGAWADRLRESLAGERKVRPQRGSHVVLMPGRLPMDEAVIFMHPQDKRPLFIYPWEGRTVIGTTDLDHRDDLDIEASMTSLEMDYILQGVNAQFPHEKITRDDVVATFSGVRPIVASGGGVNPSAERRDHSVWDDAGLITVTGGKLTTFRLIALDALCAASRYLPGINTVDTKAAVFRSVGTVETKWPISDLMRLKGRFGFYVSQFLKESVPAEMKVIPQLETLWSELRWAARYEQVQHLDDLLLRRTRIGLLMPEGGSELLPQVRAVCQAELGWDDSRWLAEEERYRDIWHKYYGVPATTHVQSAAA